MDTNKLTVEFGAPLLGGSGAKSVNRPKIMDISYLFRKKELNDIFALGKEWKDIEPIAYTYAMTVNSDWSRHQYEPEEEKQLMIKILKENSDKIKNMLLVYEYGKGGKLHFHMVINTKYIRQIEKEILMVFGNSQMQYKWGNRCTKVKVIRPNKNEDADSNMRKCINYLRKEIHNTSRCWISK